MHKEGCKPLFEKNYEKEKVRWLEKISHHRKVSIGPTVEPAINCFKYLFFDLSSWSNGT